MLLRLLPEVLELVCPTLPLYTVSTRRHHALQCLHALKLAVLSKVI